MTSQWVTVDSNKKIPAIQSQVVFRTLERDRLHNASNSQSPDRRGSVKRAEIGIARIRLLPKHLFVGSAMTQLGGGREAGFPTPLRRPWRTPRDRGLPDRPASINVFVNIVNRDDRSTGV